MTCQNLVANHPVYVMGGIVCATDIGLRVAEKSVSNAFLKNVIRKTRYVADVMGFLAVTAAISHSKNVVKLPATILEPITTTAQGMACKADESIEILITGSNQVKTVVATTAQGVASKADEAFKILVTRSNQVKTKVLDYVLQGVSAAEQKVFNAKKASLNAAKEAALNIVSGAEQAAAEVKSVASGVISRMEQAATSTKNAALNAAKEIAVIYKNTVG